AARAEVVDQVVESESRIENVFNQNDVAPLQWLVQVFDDLDLPGRTFSFVVARDGAEINAQLRVHYPHQVAHEKHCAVEHADQLGPGAGVIAGDLRPHFADAALQLICSD